MNGVTTAVTTDDLAARKAVVAAALEPLVRVVGLARPRAPEHVLHRFRGEAADRRRVDRLPERPSELGLAAFPQRARDFADNQRVDDGFLDVSVPDAAFIDGYPVIDTAGAGRQYAGGAR